ncbi:hypothetical protein PPL_10996 [Heterostelium album PN500]|uniref:Uncharacterized protein n=1 Tax=Heterostelium pallidum (strain ATCC 26659 / Pp 5 / PN500) TaxID=670386 RepID=D3BSM7_HETP5|nr:hypothetical protein PPL_10996 [Heterostelium album PN500]EFA75492.1 hypothetical protein PPL_10996 [Heterostelium album PN500]|eukprot:XP_020427626.1 hypothetical protein PPL_10996 [Heterostelium album PN500]
MVASGIVGGCGRTALDTALVFLAVSQNTTHISTGESARVHREIGMNHATLTILNGFATTTARFDFDLARRTRASMTLLLAVVLSTSQQTRAHLSTSRNWLKTRLSCRDGQVSKN